MSGAPTGDMSRKEIRTGQALNVVATIGGLNAMRMASNEFRHSLKAKPEELVQRKGVQRLQRMKGVGRLVKNPKAAALAVGGGMLALHGGELTGDAIAARALHRQAQTIKKEFDMSNEQGISKAYVSPQARTTGRGVNIEKAYRRFDPEADRQRRLGTYAGVGAGTGIALGAFGAQRLAPAGKAAADAVRKLPTHAKRSGKIGAGLAAGSLVATGLGIGAYKRGVSVRNQPWN